MFGKPEWFTYRVAGWGIRPKTWQGWVYVGVYIALIGILGALQLPEGLKNILVGILVGSVLVDGVVIWSQLGKHHDERERLHQLIIERICSIAAVTSVCAVILFRSYQNRNMIGTESFPFDPLLLAVLGTMMITKLITSIYLRYKM